VCKSGKPGNGNIFGLLIIHTNTGKQRSCNLLINCERLCYIKLGKCCELNTNVTPLSLPSIDFRLKKVERIASEKCNAASVNAVPSDNRIGDFYSLKLGFRVLLSFDNEFV
jgi:hypothetical protein